MEKKMTAMEVAIKDLRRMNTASTLYIADMLETDYLPKEREQIEEGFFAARQKEDFVPLISTGEPKYESASDYYTQTYGK